MTTEQNTQRMMDAARRASADIAQMAEWLSDEVDKYQDDDVRVTWATVNTLEHTRENLMETLAYLAGVKVTEIQRSLEELRS